MRGATPQAQAHWCEASFQSTRPMRGATQICRVVINIGVISIHAPHAGRDYLWQHDHVYRGHFNPRAPCGARRRCAVPAHRALHFNPRAPCGARLHTLLRRLDGETISIHAPHAGRDRPSPPATADATNFNPRAPCGARQKSSYTVEALMGISIHAPHAGRDPAGRTRRDFANEFQSTRPMRGATIVSKSLSMTRWRFQSTRPMRGATENPRERASRYIFQSTRPMRGATVGATGATGARGISIHAPHAGRDLMPIAS